MATGNDAGRVIRVIIDARLQAERRGLVSRLEGALNILNVDSDEIQGCLAESYDMSDLS